MLFDLLDRKKNYQYQTVLDVGVNVIRKNDSRMIYGFLFYEYKFVNLCKLLICFQIYMRFEIWDRMHIKSKLRRVWNESIFIACWSVL